MGGGAGAGSHCQRQSAWTELLGECCDACGGTQARLPEDEIRKLRAHSGLDAGTAKEHRRIRQGVESQAFLHQQVHHRGAQVEV